MLALPRGLVLLAPHRVVVAAPSCIVLFQDYTEFARHAHCLPRAGHVSFFRSLPAVRKHSSARVAGGVFILWHSLSAPAILDRARWCCALGLAIRDNAGGLSLSLRRPTVYALRVGLADFFRHTPCSKSLVRFAAGGSIRFVSRLSDRWRLGIIHRGPSICYFFCPLGQWHFGGPPLVFCLHQVRRRHNPKL